MRNLEIGSTFVLPLLILYLSFIEPNFDPFIVAPLIIAKVNVGNCSSIFIILIVLL